MTATFSIFLKVAIATLSHMNKAFNDGFVAEFSVSVLKKSALYFKIMEKKKKNKEQSRQKTI